MRAAPLLLPTFGGVWAHGPWDHSGWQVARDPKRTATGAGFERVIIEDHTGGTLRTVAVVTFPEVTVRCFRGPLFLALDHVTKRLQ
jgi:hypothetical protein